MWQSLRLAALMFCAALAGDVPLVRAARPLWIETSIARPWVPAMTAASERTGLPVALIAQVIGEESAFQTVHNRQGSTAFGFGQQIRGNSVMLRYNLHPVRPADSIMGAALELRERMDKTGSLARALDGYGTTAGKSVARRKEMLAEFDRAARWAPVFVSQTPAVPGRTQRAVVALGDEALGKAR